MCFCRPTRDNLIAWATVLGAESPRLQEDCRHSGRMRPRPAPGDCLGTLAHTHSRLQWLGMGRGQGGPLITATVYLEAAPTATLASLSPEQDTEWLASVSVLQVRPFRVTAPFAQALLCAKPCAGTCHTVSCILSGVRWAPLLPHLP